MNLQKNMICKKKIVKHIRHACLRAKLRQLERRRMCIIESYILMNPSQASRVDDIEVKIHSQELDKVKQEIKLLNRYFRIISN